MADTAPVKRPFPAVARPSASLGIRTQLASLRNMEEGWLEGGGIAPSREGLDWLVETFAGSYPEDSPRPHLYPTEDGGVQAEWSLSHWRVSLEIDLQSRCGNWFALNLETDNADERQLRCDEASDWQWLVRRIQVERSGRGDGNAGLQTQYCCFSISSIKQHLKCSRSALRPA